VDSVEDYSQEEIGMQIEFMQRQFGNVSKEQNIEKKNAHIAKQFQKIY